MWALALSFSEHSSHFHISLKGSPVFTISTRSTIVPLVPFQSSHPGPGVLAFFRRTIQDAHTSQRLSICHCLSLKTLPRHVLSCFLTSFRSLLRRLSPKRPSQTTSYKVALIPCYPSSVWFFSWCLSVPVVYSLLCFFCVFAFGYTMQHVGSLTRDRTHTPLHWKSRVLITGPPGSPSTLCVYCLPIRMWIPSRQ